MKQTRRGFLGKIAAAAAVVAAVPAVKAEAAPPTESERYFEACRRGARAAIDATAISEEEWLFVPRGYVDMREQTFALKTLEQEREHWRAEGYDRGVQRGLQARIEAWLDINMMERRVVAHIDDKYVAVALEL